MSRVDKLIKERYPHLSHTQIEEALEKGWVTGPNAATLKKGQKVEDDIVLDFAALEKQLEIIKKGNSSLSVTVISDEKDYWIVDKPAGIASHPLRLSDLDTLTQWAFARDKNIAEKFESYQPTIVPHRLDRDTSGVMIVTKNAEAYEKWRERFQKGQMKKTYLAWCWGNPTRKEWESNGSIAHHPSDPKKMVCVLSGERFREPVLTASSQIEVVKKAWGAFLARVTCFTGVTHQVRVHLGHAGFPLVGDALYDASFHQRDSKPDRHLLRAVELCWQPEDRTFKVDSAQFEGLIS